MSYKAHALAGYIPTGDVFQDTALSYLFHREQFRYNWPVSHSTGCQSEMVLLSLLDMHIPILLLSEDGNYDQPSSLPAFPITVYKNRPLLPN
jgi:hypothetical protein